MTSCSFISIREGSSHSFTTPSTERANNASRGGGKGRKEGRGGGGERGRREMGRRKEEEGGTEWKEGIVSVSLEALCCRR